MLGVGRSRQRSDLMGAPGRMSDLDSEQRERRMSWEEQRGEASDGADSERLPLLTGLLASGDVSDSSKPPGLFDGPVLADLVVLERGAHLGRAPRPEREVEERRRDLG